MNAIVPAQATSAQWAAHIAACWSASVVAVLETGRLLTAAKAALEHGEFGVMIESALPFSASTAQRLMAIAADPRLSNAAHVQHLPPHWGTLYEISKLDDEQFAAKLASGVIRPDVERAEIAAVRKAIRNAPAVADYNARVNAGCSLADLERLADSGATFGSLHADPDWKFETWSDKGKDRSPTYETSPTEEIEAMGALVRRLAGKNSILHLWCIDSMLPDALRVIDAWGFKYIKVGFVWTKAGFMGLGDWTRNGAELCLLATKGHPVRRSAAVRQVIDAPIGKHSEKPAEIYERVAKLAGGPYLDLFARAERDNWTTWGNEIPRTTFLSKVTASRGEERPPAVTNNQISDQHRAFIGDDDLDIPAFLRRKSDNSFPDSVPVASPRKAHLVNAGDGG